MTTAMPKGTAPDVSSHPVAHPWRAEPARQRNSRLRSWLDRHHFESYDAAWEWSVDPASAGDFWADMASVFDVKWLAPAEAPVEADPDAVPGVKWFPGARLNYAELPLRMALERSDQVVVKARSQTRPDRDLTGGHLAAMVAAVRRGLLDAGVGRGDCVAGYLPNIPEALAAMLAAASIGAVWAGCAPEMGVPGCLDRLTQADPVVLISVDGYRYGSRVISRREEARDIRAGLANLRAAIWLPYLDGAARAPEGWLTWAEFAAEDGAEQGSGVLAGIEPVAFDHPLYVLFSSGTTGRPKAIVHSHGGITLEHAKALGLHFDLGPSDTFFWYTTTGWMMWNFLVSGLLVGAAIVLYDGDPAGPAGDRLWELMAATGTTCGGVGAGYLVAGAKARLEPGRAHDLSALLTLGSTGSPLPATAAEWVYRSVKEDVLLASFSGGTDVCTGFVGASPLHPVWAGEISCRCLGARVEVFGDDGRPVVGREGELVLSAPLPSMPVGFLHDPGGARYMSAYFERFGGVWAHGDRATLTDRGTIVISGRSDGTLNRGGVRMGTAEFYSIVEALDEVDDSLVVHVEDPGGGPGELLLFVVPSSPAASTQAMEGRLRAALRDQLSPRHVPDRIEVVPAIPRTLSGKKLEVPVKRILSGVPPAEAVALASVADVTSLEPFVDRARRRTDSRTASI